MTYRVGTVHDEPLEKDAGDLLLYHLRLGLGEQVEQHAAEVVRVLVRVPELVGHRVEEEVAALGVQLVGQLLSPFFVIFMVRADGRPAIGTCYRQIEREREVNAEEEKGRGRNECGVDVGKQRRLRSNQACTNVKLKTRLVLNSQSRWARQTANPSGAAAGGWGIVISISLATPLSLEKSCAKLNMARQKRQERPTTWTTLSPRTIDAINKKMPCGYGQQTYILFVPHEVVNGRENTNNTSIYIHNFRRGQALLGAQLHITTVAPLPLPLPSLRCTSPGGTRPWAPSA